MAQRRQVVMAFDARPDMRSARLRGGKGAYLAHMQDLGLPVPPGFTITSTVARAVTEHGRFPNRMQAQLHRELAALEKRMGKKLGDIQNPLLLSVRSGAEVSMPGMMDTILNLGMNDKIRDTITSCYGSTFANECYQRLVGSFDALALKFSQDPYEQLQAAITSVLESWNSERAIAYRRENGIPHNLGTAVNVQAMVFGNRDKRSGTGVAFSRDPNTGKPGLYGEFLPCAQGEDIVSGVRTPQPLSALAVWNAGIYQELARYAELLESELGAIADIEFTIESGKLWLLQCRKAKLSAEAAATFAVHQHWAKRWSKEQAVNSVGSAQLETLHVCAAFDPEHVAQCQHRIVGRGLSASPGVAVGLIATSAAEALEMKASGLRVILVRPQTRPEDIEGMIAADAIVTFTGGTTSHAAVVARQLGKPAVVGATLPWVFQFRKREALSVCGTTGTIYDGDLGIVSRPQPKEVNIFLKWVAQMRPAPRINFDAVHRHQNVCSVLVDVYLSEAMAHAARGSALAAEANILHQKVVVKTAEDFACYLAIAVNSESRYSLELYRLKHLPANLIHTLQDEYNLSRRTVRGDAEILSTLSLMSVAEHAIYFSLAKTMFSCAEAWRSGNIGGAKWATIANAAHAFLSGAWNHGTFVDHVFDLRHNGGRLFDKHDMFDKEEQIELLLNLKRDASTVDDLAKVFRDHSDRRLSGLYGGRSLNRAWMDYIPSQEIRHLWEKGRKAGLWKEDL